METGYAIFAEAEAINVYVLYPVFAEKVWHTSRRSNWVKTVHRTYSFLAQNVFVL